MSSRIKARLGVAGWVGLCLVLAAAGCHLQVSFVDPSPKPPEAPANATAARPPDGISAPVIQTNGYAPSTPPPGAPAPIMTPAPGNFPPPTYNGAPPIANGPPPTYNGAPAPPYATMPAGPGAPPGPGGPGGPMPQPGYIPTEKAMTSHPPYVIEPPDILLLDPIRLTPKPPYTVSPLDVLLVRVAGTPADAPIDGQYTITPDGTINLGFSYGQIRVAGLTLEEVERVIRTSLKSGALKDPQVAVGLASFRGVQQTRGEHLVRQDGTISLGSYGCVYVAGLTLAQAKVAIERHLCQWLQEPEVSVDVFAYNSKVYYVITDGAGYGMNVYRFPITGKETVLDAISNIQGLPAVASRKKIWVARPAPPEHGCSQVLPVDWLAIAEGGVTSTNWQLFPGDRVYVQADCLITADNVLAKVLAPFERVLGFLLLSSFTFQSFRGQNGNNGGGGAIIGF